MEIKFTNGATVNRMWEALTDGELIAAFQYDRDALDFAKTKVADPREPEACWYVVTDHRCGKVTVVRRAPKATVD